jgi:hypothetical protein
MSSEFPDRVTPVERTTVETTHVERAGAAAATSEALRHHPTTASDYWADRYNMDVLERLRPFGQILLLAGLILAMLARGWDAVGDRHAAGVTARVQKEMSEFNDKWEDRLDKLQDEENAIRADENFTAADRDRLAALREEQQDIERERVADQRRQQARWSDLERSARESEAENRLAKPWREGLFVFGSLLFAMGLLGIGFTTEGPVRWFCLVLLAIVVIGTFYGTSFTAPAQSALTSMRT